MAKGLFDRIETAYNKCRPLHLKPGDVASIYHLLMEEGILSQDKFEAITAFGHEKILYLRSVGTPIKNSVDKT